MDRRFMVPFDLLRLHSKANTNACKRYDLHRTPSPLQTGVPSQPHHSTAQHGRHRDLQLQGKTVFDLQTTAAVACVYFSLTKKPGTLLRPHAVMLNWCRNDAFKNHSEFVSFIARTVVKYDYIYFSSQTHRMQHCLPQHLAALQMTYEYGGAVLFACHHGHCYYFPTSLLGCNSCNNLQEAVQATCSVKINNSFKPTVRVRRDKHESY